MSDPKAVLAALGGTSSPGNAPLPAIPAVPNSDNYALNNILSSVKLWIEKASGNGLTGFASKQDLVNAGLIKTDALGNVVSTVDLDLSIPPVPTGLTASGAMTNILVQWDNPTAAYKNHAYTEIWAAQTNNFTNAVMVGQSSGLMFAHAVNEDSTRYYWIRFVSAAGLKGPFNSVNGTSGTTARNVGYLMGSLTAAYGTTSAAPFFQIDQATVINGVSIPAGTYMKAAFIADATITNAMIQNLSADKITAGYISADRIAANSLTADKINGNSLAVVNGTFSGTLQAATGTFTGSLSAATGTFAGRLAAGVLDPSAFSGTTYTYSTPGYYVVTVPNLGGTSTSMRITLQGAGGGGGGGGASSNVNYCFSGGGGGAGSLVTVTISGVTPGAQYGLTVGSGGAGGTVSGGGFTITGGSAGGSTSMAGYVASGGGGGGKGDPYSWTQGTGGSIGGEAGQVTWLGDLVGSKGGRGGSSAYGAGGGPDAGGGVGAGGGGASAGPGDVDRNGAAGGNGYASIEFFDPDTVVLRNEFEAYKQTVTSSFNATNGNVTNLTNQVNGMVYVTNIVSGSTYNGGAYLTVYYSNGTNATITIYSPSVAG